MSTDRERLERLEESYRKLWEQHIALKEQIKENYSEFKQIREQMGIPAAQAIPSAEAMTGTKTAHWPEDRSPVSAVSRPEPPKPAKKPAGSSTWEQYVGEQLLSKIGIVILVIGVGIGAKYAIDHELLSPWMRIGGGYVIAAILGFFAYRFREKYTAFSAILVSGAMAVTYFITYAAYIFYGLYPYWLTFVLLLLTTVGTVIFALRYNQVVIAHFGLVGAYVLPVLIAAKASHFSNYLMYMAVINCGILFISFLRDWKSLYHVAFGWTTLVFVSWFFQLYDPAVDKGTAIGFLCLFFVLFQSVSLAYPLVRKKLFHGRDLFLVIPNMLAFFAMGHYVLNGETIGPVHADFVFGLAVAALFFVLWRVFRSVRSEDRLLQETHFVIGTGALTLAFILELSGRSLPVVLVIETCLLGWLAIRSNWRFLDILTTVLTVICGIAILGNIAQVNGNLLSFTPFANRSFLLTFGGILLAGAVFAMLRKQFTKEELSQYSIPDGLLLLALIGGFCVLGNEIALDFKHAFAAAKEESLNAGADFSTYGKQWLRAMVMGMMAFTGVYWLFVVWLDRSVIGFRNAKEWIQTCSVVVILGMLVTITFNSLWDFSAFGTSGGLHLVYTFSRYSAFAAIVGIGWPWLRSSAKTPRLLTMVHIAILWILSLEMTHWLTLNGNQNAHKLSLSILWGIYAIYILYLGIVKPLAALRVTAMIILAITLVKLFFFDITRLSTIAKTVLFMLLGGLLLVGAYFYQRYKASEEPGEEDDKPGA